MDIFGPSRILKVCLKNIVFLYLFFFSCGNKQVLILSCYMINHQIVFDDGRASEKQS